MDRSLRRSREHNKKSPKAFKVTSLKNENEMKRKLGSIAGGERERERGGGGYGRREEQKVIERRVRVEVMSLSLARRRYSD